jgi:hypothetical protein
MEEQQIMRIDIAPGVTFFDDHDLGPRLRPTA